MKFPSCISEIFPITLLYPLLLVSLYSCSGNNDPIDPNNPIDPSDPSIEKSILECTDKISSDCPLVGQWTYINSGCVPVNDYQGFITGGLIGHKNSIVFNSNGKVFFTYLTDSELWGNWSNTTRFYDVVNCEYIKIRSQDNEVIDQIEIIELTENRLRLRNNNWCGVDDCLFIKTPKPYHDDKDNIALNQEICKLHKCKSCGDNNSGFECSISYKYIDITGDLTYVSSKKYRDKIVICTKDYLICINNNFEVQWKYSIDFGLKGYDEYSHKVVNNFAIDNEGNIYIFYYTDNPQTNYANSDIPNMSKFDINGNLKFHKKYDYQAFKRSGGYSWINVDHEIKYHDNELYFVHSGLLAKFDLDGNLLILKESGNQYRKKFYPMDDRIYIGNEGIPNETIDFVLENISPVNYQYSSVLGTNNYSTNAFIYRTYTMGNKLLISGDFNRSTGHSVWGYHVPGIIVQFNEVVDIVRSFNFRHSGSGGRVVPISDTSMISYFTGDYTTGDHIELITQVNGKFRPSFRYRNEINSSNYYDDFKFLTAYQIDNKLFLLGSGKRFTKTILGVIIDLDILYPDVSCQ